MRPFTDPGANIIAVPEMEKGSTTEVLTSIGTGTDRALFLYVPGVWRIRCAAAVTVLVFEIPDLISALFYGGVKVGGGLVSVAFTPGTFTAVHAAENTIDAASETVLAAGSYKHLYFRNTSTGGQRITISADGGAAVDKEGWVLAPDPTGAGYGEIISWNHPDVMPVGDFLAIASAAGGKLIVSSGT